jgi:hypothetical protein
VSIFCIFFLHFTSPYYTKVKQNYGEENDKEFL